MKLSYTEVFKYSDVLNPVSLTALFSAGKLAQLEPKKYVLDLGSGKGFPSLSWASIFGVRVDGFDITEKFVEYANSRAKILNLSHRAKYSCRDIEKLKVNRKYDVVASLGLGIAQVYGSEGDAFRVFKTMLRKNGVLVLAEPVWLAKPVSSKVLKALGEAEDSLRTKPEMQELLREYGFQELGNFVSSKEAWEIYVRPIYVAMQEIIHSKSKLAEEAQRVINGFRAEYNAVGHHWNMVLWVAKSVESQSMLS
jgi:cyclopropane fatty-acyl-phospholipid synthase-like methyltransferase